MLHRGAPTCARRRVRTYTRAFPRFAAISVALSCFCGGGGGVVWNACAAGESMEHKTIERPNMVLIVTDQERAPPPYENDDLAAFRSEHLHGYRELGCVADDDGASDAKADARCLQFNRHYTSSTACTPSRANLFTGQYSSVHGVRSTDGVGKTASGPEILPLPLDVPTMGHYFEAAGYETRYVGKWHLSHENLSKEQTKPLGTGIRDRKAEREYLDRDGLGKYGFHGWVGPEPHGPAKGNTGKWRDPQFVEQALEWIEERNATAAAADGDSGRKPFLLVLSIVNPHDICLWAVWKSIFRFEVTDGTVPRIPEPPTFREDLSTKPSPQAQWREYAELFFSSPVGAEEEYRQFYYYLHKLADRQVAAVLRALKDTPFWDDTIVVRTSDHGEMLGAHGLRQKWYAAYDELLRVPLVVSSPLFGRGLGRKEFDFPTSSVDVLPTMLSLAGLDREKLRENLASTHAEAHPLVGRDLTPILLHRNGEEAAIPTAVYSHMSDHVTRGNSQVLPLALSLHPVAKAMRRWYHFEIDAIQGPASMEAVVADLGNGSVWKLVRTYDDAALWSSPHECDAYTVRAGLLTTRASEVVRAVPFEDEWELYDLSEDPGESANLAHEAVLAALESDEARRRASVARASLVRLMEKLRREKLLQRTYPLPAKRVRSSEVEDHENDIFDITFELYGRFGPPVLGALWLLFVIVYQEPLVLGLLAVCLLLVFGTFAYASLAFECALFGRQGKRKVKVS